MSLVIQISGKFFPEISAIGETPSFIDFTPEEIASDGYLKIGLKSFEIPAAIVDGQATANDGKVALMAQIEVVATAYLETVLTDAEAAYDAKIYVLNIERKNIAGEGVTEESKYTSKDDVFDVQVRFEANAAAAPVLPIGFLQTTIVDLDGTNYALTVTVENDDEENPTESVDVVFSGFGANEPIPTNLNMSSFTGTTTKVFTLNTFTFTTPESAVGLEFVVSLSAKNNALDELAQADQDVVVSA